MNLYRLNSGATVTARNTVTCILKVTIFPMNLVFLTADARDVT